MTLRILRILIIAVGFLWLLGGFMPAGASDTLALTPRVFLPLTMRAWEYIPLSESRLGASDGYLTKMVNSQSAMDLFRSAGGVYNRTSILWDQVEPTNRAPKHYNWAVPDSILNPLIAKGIQPFVMIFVNPSWASNTPCGPLYNNNDMVQFITALAKRYPAVKYWALYNEVDNMTYVSGKNLGGCFGSEDLDQNGTPDYADYAELSRVVWKALREANPNAMLSIGQLAYDNFSAETRPDWYPGGCCFNYHFLGNLLGYMRDHPLPDGEKYADVLGFSDYLYYIDLVWQARYNEIGIGAKAAAVREVMAQYGQNFPLVITEMSGSSTHQPNGISLDEQARQVAQMMAQGYFYDIKALIWWTYDDFPDSCSFNPNCSKWKVGLVDQNLAPKPAYTAYQTIDRQLRGFSPVEADNGPDVVRLTFRRGTITKYVFYSKSDSGTPLVLDSKRVLVTDMYGNRTFYVRKHHQPIQIQLGSNPVYVQFRP